MRHAAMILDLFCFSLEQINKFSSQFNELKLTIYEHLVQYIQMAERSGVLALGSIRRVGYC